MLWSMECSPCTLGENTVRVRSMVMLGIVASCSMPAACTKPRSGRSSGTSAAASSLLDVSQRRAEIMELLW